MSYHLIYIVTGGEFRTPLIATQLFDRAQTQAVIDGAGKPLSVSVWIIEPMRILLDEKSKNVVKALRKRCPDVAISFVGGISRLNEWPALLGLRFLRSKLGKAPAVYHCRGEASADWALKVKKYYSKDRIVLDIRGYWPLERLSLKGIYDDSALLPADAKQYEADKDRLRQAILNTDTVTTVSKPLAEFLIRHFNAPADTLVVPCCVSGTVDSGKREYIREKLGLQKEYAILYLGGTQKYQHLDDLVLPFLEAAIRLNDKIMAIFITQDKDKMQQLISSYKLPEDRYRLLSVPQKDVADYLTAMDAGVLLRAPSLMNNFAQPVKLGEYLGAGLPVIVEKGTGCVGELLRPYDIGYELALTGKNALSFDNEVLSAISWIEKDIDGGRSVAAKAFVDSQYTWLVNTPHEREMYTKIIGK